MPRFLAASALLHLILFGLLYRSPGAVPATAPATRLAITVQAPTTAATHPAGSAATAANTAPAAARHDGAGLASAAPQPAPARPAAATAAVATVHNDDDGMRDHAYDSWLGEVRAALAAAKTYPARARLQGREGRVDIRFRVGPDGRVVAAELLNSSGHRLLDRAALRLAGETRVPPPPSAAAAAQALTVTLYYGLDDRQAAAASCSGCNNSG